MKIFAAWSGKTYVGQLEAWGWTVQIFDRVFFYLLSFILLSLHPPASHHSSSPPASAITNIVSVRNYTVYFLSFLIILTRVGHFYDYCKFTMSCRRKPNYIYLIQVKEIREEKLLWLLLVVLMMVLVLELQAIYYYLLTDYVCLYDFYSFLFEIIMIIWFPKLKRIVSFDLCARQQKRCVFIFLFNELFQFIFSCH